MQIIREWQINEVGNVGGHEIPANWRLVAHRVVYGDNQVVVEVCAFTDDSHSVPCSYTERKAGEFTTAYANSTPETIAKTVVEGILDQDHAGQYTLIS